VAGQPPKERRKSKRAPLELTVTFQVQGQMEKTTTINASSRGFFVRTSNALPVGTTIPFTLEHSGLGGLFKIVGRIVHIMEERSGGAGMGVEIKQIAPNQDPQFDAYRSMIEKAHTKK